MSFHSYLHFTPFKTGLQEGSSRAVQTSVSVFFKVYVGGRDIKVSCRVSV